MKPLRFLSNAAVSCFRWFRDSYIEIRNESDYEELVRLEIAHTKESWKEIERAFAQHQAQLSDQERNESKLDALAMGLTPAQKLNSDFEKFLMFRWQTNPGVSEKIRDLKTTPDYGLTP